MTHGGTVRTGLLVAALAVSGAADARAQTTKPAAQGQPARPRPAFRPGSVEVDGGVLWLSAIDFGSTTGSIAANRTPAAEYPLFNTAGELSAGPAYEGRVGVRLTRMIGVEGAFQYSRQTLETRITNDVENAAGVTASNDLSRYVLEVSGVFHLTRLKLGKGGSPFVLGGIGYLRELDEEQAHVETGRLYHVGGGFKYLFSARTHGLVKGLGLRADARLYFRDGGFTLTDTDQLRRYFGGGASFLVAF